MSCDRDYLKQKYGKFSFAGEHYYITSATTALSEQEVEELKRFFTQPALSQPPEEINEKVARGLETGFIKAVWTTDLDGEPKPQLFIDFADGVLRVSDKEEREKRFNDLLSVLSYVANDQGTMYPGVFIGSYFYDALHFTGADRSFSPADREAMKLAILNVANNIEDKRRREAAKKYLSKTLASLREWSMMMDFLGDEGMAAFLDEYLPLNKAYTGYCPCVLYHYSKLQGSKSWKVFAKHCPNEAQYAEGIHAAS